jgi:hypothetical protein
MSDATLPVEHVLGQTLRSIVGSYLDDVEGSTLSDAIIEVTILLAELLVLIAKHDRLPREFYVDLHRLTLLRTMTATTIPLDFGKTASKRPKRSKPLSSARMETIERRAEGNALAVDVQSALVKYFDTKDSHPYLALEILARSVGLLIVAMIKGGRGTTPQALVEAHATIVADTVRNSMEMPKDWKFRQ